MSKSVLHQILDRSGFSPVTKDKYRLVIDRWIDFAGTDPSSWTRDRAQEFYDQLLDGGIAVQSANTYMASLRYVSRWYATKSGGLDFAIVQRQRGKKGKTRLEDGEKAFLSEDEAYAMIETCREPTFANRRDLAMMVTMLETGMRRMSIRGLDFDNVYEREGIPSARVPIKGAGGEETFTVPLSNVAYAALVHWMRWLAGDGVRSGAVFRRLSPRVDGRGHHHVEIGNVISDTGINEVIETRAKLANIRHISPHMFRHTFISLRRAMGFNDIEIAAITGHQVPAVVVRMLSTYSHALDVEKIRNSTPDWLKHLVEDLLVGSAKE